MERLTIDEVIEHCNKTCDMTEKIAKERGHELESIESNQFWEHYQVRAWLKELKRYKDLEEQGLLLQLPIADGTTVYIIDNNTDACTDGCEYFNVGYCCEDYCSMKNVEDDVYPQLSDIPVCEKQYLEVTELKPKLDWIFHNRDNFGKTVFLTQAEAEQKVKELKKEKIKISEYVLD